MKLIQNPYIELNNKQIQLEIKDNIEKKLSEELEKIKSKE